MKEGKGVLYGVGALLLIAAGIFALQSGGGLLGFLGKAVVWGIGAVVVLIIAIVVLVIVLSMRSSSRNEGAAENSTSARRARAAELKQEEKDVLADARRDLTALRQIMVRIKDPQIKTLGGQIYRQADKILNTLREKPEAIFRARQFLNYYLPTLTTILGKYAQMEQGGVVAPDMSAKMLEHLKNIQIATEKQYSNLFVSDILDLTMEMEVMTMACRRDGLLTEQESTLESEEGNITLTL